MEIYTPLLCFWSRRAGVPSSSAADLVQDVFLELVKHLPQFKYDAKRSFRAWVRTVTINKWRERLDQDARARLLFRWQSIFDAAGNKGGFITQGGIHSISFSGDSRKLLVTWAFKKQLYRPDVIKLLLQTGDVEKAVAIAQRPSASAGAVSIWFMM